jgi:hypothetical protein
MATQINRIPPPSVPLVDVQTGIVNEYWWDFFSVLAGGQPLKDFASDAAAAAGGVPINGFYRTASAVKIRVT